MDKIDFSKLQRGDLVINSGSRDGTVYVITGNYGDHVTAVVTRDLTNPSEWEIVGKATYE